MQDSKYNVKHYELMYMYTSVIKFICKEMWIINGNADHYNDAVLNKEEYNAVIYDIICFLTAVSYMELYHLFNVYMFVDLESPTRC